MPKLIPILMYHKYQPDFEQLLTELREREYSVVHLSELTEYIQDPHDTCYPEKTLVLTFDDALQDFFTDYRPLLIKHGYTATVCVATGYVSDNETNRRHSDWPHHGRKRPIMTWQELGILVKEGFEIVSHSVKHIPFIDERLEKNQECLIREIEDSRQVLTKRLDIEVSYFAFPYGAGWGRESTELLLANAGYVGALRAQFEADKGWAQYTIPRWEITKDKSFSAILQEIKEYNDQSSLASCQ